MTKANGNFTHRDGVSLQYHLESRIKAVEETAAAALAALTQATTLSKENLEIRLAGMNEWRAQSKDREEAYATKSDVANIRDAVDRLRLSEARLAGKASQGAVTVSYVISGIGIALGIAGLLMR